MNYLKTKLTPSDITIIGQELERLFTLQDKMFTESKKSMFITELDNEGYPPQAIVKGIRALADQDIKSLKFFVLKESIRKFIHFEEKTTDCPYCRGFGRVSMVHESNSFAFACKCESGQKWGKEYPRWNGDVKQRINGSDYELYDHYALGPKYYDWLKLHGVKEAPHREFNDRQEVKEVLRVVGRDIPERKTYYEDGE